MRSPAELGALVAMGSAAMEVLCPCIIAAINGIGEGAGLDKRLSELMSRGNQRCGSDPESAGKERPGPFPSGGRIVLGLNRLNQSVLRRYAPQHIGKVPKSRQARPLRARLAALQLGGSLCCVLAVKFKSYPRRHGPCRSLYRVRSTRAHDVSLAARSTHSRPIRRDGEPLEAGVFCPLDGLRSQRLR